MEMASEHSRLREPNRTHDEESNQRFAKPFYPVRVRGVRLSFSDTENQSRLLSEQEYPGAEPGYPALLFSVPFWSVA